MSWEILRGYYNDHSDLGYVDPAEIRAALIRRYGLEMVERREREDRIEARIYDYNYRLRMLKEEKASKREGDST